MTTIAEVISRVRNMIKAVKQDAFITDRFIYSLVKKQADTILAREDSRMKLFNYLGIVQSIDYVELEEVDRVQSGLRGIKSGCSIKRTTGCLPEFFDGYYGPLIIAVTSISGNRLEAFDEDDIQITTPSTYADIVKSSTFKYNKKKYCWFMNKHLYFPDQTWDAVRIEAIGPGDFSQGCEYSCAPRQEGFFNIPDKLFLEIEQGLKADLGLLEQIPTDPIDDKQNPNR